MELIDRHLPFERKSQGYDDKFLWWGHTPDVAALSQSHARLPRARAKADGWWDGLGSLIPLIWGSEEGGGVGQRLLGFLMGSGAPLFIVCVHVYPTTRSLVPLHQSVICPSPYVLVHPSWELILLLNVKPSTGKSSLTLLYQLFCHPCPVYWLCEFDNVVCLFLTAFYKLCLWICSWISNYFKCTLQLNPTELFTVYILYFLPRVLITRRSPCHLLRRVLTLHNVSYELWTKLSLLEFWQSSFLFNFVSLKITSPEKCNYISKKCDLEFPAFRSSKDTRLWGGSEELPIT